MEPISLENIAQTSSATGVLAKTIRGSDRDGSANDSDFAQTFHAAAQEGTKDASMPGAEHSTSADTKLRSRNSRAKAEQAQESVANSSPAKNCLTLPTDGAQNLVSLSPAALVVSSPAI